MKKRALLYSVPIFLFLACNSRQKAMCSFETKKFVSDTFRLQHSIDSPIQVSQIVSLFDLDNIGSGYNGRQIRIWLGHSLAKKRHIVILKLIDSEWRGEILTFTQHNPSRSYSNLKILDYKKVIPNSGWNEFINKVNESEILKDEFWKSPNCCGVSGTDGISYHFEIATPNSYSEHSFSNPFNNNEAGRKILSFASFLETELCFEYSK